MCEGERSTALSVNQIRGKHFARNEKGIALQTEVVNVLHFVAPVVDESLVEENGVLCIPQHHVAMLNTSIMPYGSWNREGKQVMRKRVLCAAFAHLLFT